ncbi:hypothetical protein [Amycolatopsis sp. NPDC006125]
MARLGLPAAGRWLLGRGLGVPCADEAPVLVRLLALTGRDPEWRA